MKVLVTGSGGWIGRNCVQILKERGHKVHPFKWGSHPPKCDHVLHLAWETTPGEFWNSPLNRDWFLVSNMLLREFADGGGKRIVVAGTGADTSTPYGMAKDALRRVLEAYSDVTGIESAYAKIYYLYGPNEKPQRLIPSIIINLLKGKEYTIGKAGLFADFSHVYDVANALVSILESDVTGSVDIGSELWTLGEVGQMIAKKIGCPELLKLGTVPSDNYVSGVRFASDIKYDISTGLDETIEWWRQRLLVDGNQE